MTPPNVSATHRLYELCWKHAQDCTIAIETDRGIVVDANPAAEFLTGYPRSELIGTHVVLLHPEAERQSVLAEFQHPATHSLPHTGFHIQRKDGRSLPVAI